MTGEVGGRNLAPYKQGTPERDAWDEGWRLGHKEYTKKLPPSEDMEATAGSEFI